MAPIVEIVAEDGEGDLRTGVLLKIFNTYSPSGCMTQRTHTQGVALVYCTYSPSG